jgi:transposase
MGDLSDFPKRIDHWCAFSGASLIKPATLLGVSRVAVSKVMLAYTYHGKTTSVKMNSTRKSTLTERDRHTLMTVSKIHTVTAAQMIAELSIHREDHVSTKTVRHELHKSSIHDRAT